MNNITKEVKKIFSKNLGISVDKIKNTLSYVKSDKWDSLNHMKIVAQIEKKYKIQLKMIDIIAMETFGKSISIINRYLKKK
jgi:acyl carrier protein|tara:strand:+ start:1195 stop:1437 length:243 start_codon:yes stop_codon:yes gene_type:complete